RGAEVYAAGIKLVHRHGVAQHVDIAIALRETVGESLPLVASGTTAVDAQFSFRRVMFRVALDGHDVDGFRLVRVDVDDKAEVRGQVAADFVPVVAGIVAAHDVPVLLHEEHAGARRIHGDAVHAMANLGGGVGHDFGPQSAG